MEYKYKFKDYKFKHLGQNLLLHPFKSIFWEDTKILFLSDLHIGKAAHFRKAGIPIPELVHSDDFSKMNYLIKTYQPRRLVFLGDLFHSEYNKAWEEFKKYTIKYIQIKPELVIGNHDILDESHYSFMDIHRNTLIIEPFILTHQPMAEEEISEFYNLCGHLHPSVRIFGAAKQSFRVECFYFGQKQGILPAFGNFTGTSKLLKKAKNDKTFAITENEVIPLHQNC